MDIDKLDRIITLLRQNGVLHYKTDKLEIHLAPAVSVEKQKQLVMQVGQTKSPPAQAVPPAELTIPHHVNEVASLLKLNDEALVDKLFPDYSQLAEQG